MPNYEKLSKDTEAGKRAIERLLKLRQELRGQIPERSLHDTLLLATWNIRDFDKPAYGARVDEAIYYIAEIISHFDIVAIQEVYKEMTGLDRVMELLGDNWRRVFTDETMGRQGNDERLVFVYDSNKVTFGGLASELVLPPVEDEQGNLVPVSQVARTPFIVGFKSGWSVFMLATVHILWGVDEEDDAANPEQRVREIREVAQFLKARSTDEAAWARNIILLGDFNIFGIEDPTFQQLVEAGFIVPEELLEFRSNALQTRHYDQIAFLERRYRLEPTGNAGVFNYYDVVFRDADEDRDIYAPFMRKSIQDANLNKSPSKRSKEYDQRTEAGKTLYYRTYWRTHQMSDHLPMWVELKIDYADEYLQRKLAADL